MNIKNLVDQYTTDMQQSHQCGFIAQRGQQIQELKHRVIGGESDEDGKDTIRCFSYSVIFSFAVKAIQELSEKVKQQQQQVDEHSQHEQK